MQYGSGILLVPTNTNIEQQTSALYFLAQASYPLILSQANKEHRFNLLPKWGFPVRFSTPPQPYRTTNGSKSVLRFNRRGNVSS